MNALRERFSRGKKISDCQFGAVYEATEITTGLTFAMKEMGFNDKNKKVLDREVELQQQFSHPNILPLKAVFVASPYMFLFTPLCQFDLGALLAKTVLPLRRNLLQSLSRDILRGLEAMHQKRVYHRDVKPRNILIDEKFRALICDFGCATDESRRREGKFDAEGFTVWYKAPELLMGKRDYGFEIDIWSFGCVFAEMLNGAPLFATRSELELLGKITALLGEPNAQSWPGIEALPNFGKIAFLPRAPVDLHERFVEASSDELDFLSKCIKYGSRPTARELLSHAYLQSAQPTADQRIEPPDFTQTAPGDFFEVFLR